MMTLQALADKIVKSGIQPPALALEWLLTTGETIGFCSLVQIEECTEPLIEISGPFISCAEPHPHSSIGAEYGEYRPFCVREGVLERLNQAAQFLSMERPGYRLYIYDAYRPLSVQQFMINYEFSRLAEERGLKPGLLSEAHYQDLMNEVLMVWAKPDADWNSPPPHSTGAAVDLTIKDERGDLLDMGSAIDVIGEVSLPSYFSNTVHEPERGFHSNRELLNRVMTQAGFCRLPHEWWHFSYGDQLWAMMEWLDHPEKTAKAIYGRVE